MRAVIIEDEKLSAEHLMNMLTRIDPTIEVVGIFDSIKRSVEFFNKDPQVDLLFVDIHIADGNSFDIFQKVLIDKPIIFTTAFQEYAIKAFKLNSIDYLLKPIGIEELKTSITKFKKWNGENSKKIKEVLESLSTSSADKEYKNRFLVKLGDTITSVKTDEIAHFIAEDGVVILVTKTGKRFSVDYTLDQLEQIVDKKLFFRINRKVLIYIDQVQKVNTYFNSRLKINNSFLEGDDGIVSRERVVEFKSWLDK